MTTRVTGNSAPRDARNEDAKREILKRIRDAQQPVSYTHLTLPTILRV